MKNKFNTEEIKLLIPDYITGSLSEEESILVKNAIESSAELKELYAGMKSAFAFVDTVKYEEPSPQYWNNLLPKIHKKIDEREQQSLAKNPLSYIWKILVPVAAVVLIFIIYRIAYTPDTEITQKDTEKIIQKQNETKDTVVQKTEPVKTQEPVEKQTANNTATVKKTYRHKEPEIVHPVKEEKENIEKQDEFRKLEGENYDIASNAVEELTIFGAGTQGGFDEELDNELDKLNNTEQEILLEQLTNSNL